MNVFLTGATGVVGTRALPALVAAGHTVTAVARGQDKAALVSSLGGTPVAVDLFDADAVTAGVTGHDVVVHLATNIPPLSKASRLSAWAMNDRLRGEASVNLVDAAIAAGATRYVQESVCFPYLDGGSDWVNEDRPVDHGPPAYKSAGAAEAQAQRFTDSATDHAGVVLRFGMFYAPEAGHTVAMNRLVRWHLSPFIGAPDAYGSFVHAEDAGTAVAAALGVPAGIFNVVDDEPLTRAASAEAVAARLGVRRPRHLPRWTLRLNPSAAALAKSLRVSHAKLTEATGWTPAHPSIRDSWPAEAGR